MARGLDGGSATLTRIEPVAPGRWAHPLLPLALLAVAAAVVMAVPFALPIGANYWDLYFHIDAAYRISVGQVPHVDFFAPAGALPFQLLAWMMALAPRAQPLMAAQVGMLLLTLPLMAAVALEVDRRSRWQALWLTLPFAAFSLLPINAIEFYPSPGSDGVGLYNRQSGYVLYVFVAAIVAMADGWTRRIVLAVALAALFFIKINAFIAGALMLAAAVVCSLLPLRSALAAGAGAAALILGFGLGTGILGAYLSDIAAMAAHNSGYLLTRVVTVVSVKFDVLLPLGLLGLALLVRDAGAMRAMVAGRAEPSLAARLWGMGRDLCATDAARLLAFGGLALAVEAQNTGSQEFLFLWPLLLALLLKALAAGPAFGGDWARAAVILLIAASTLPSAMKILHRTARLVAVAPGYQTLEAPGLKALARVSAKDMHLAHARAMLVHYPRARRAYAALAELGEMPSTILMSEMEFQAFYLLEVAVLLDALKAHEAATGRRYEVMSMLDHVDLMPYLTGRAPLKGITISLDLGRGYPSARHPRLLAALETADALFIPRCPATPFRRDIERLARPVLDARETIPINPCWDMSVKRAP